MPPAYLPARLAEGILPNVSGPGQRVEQRLTCHVVGCRGDLYEIGVTHGVLHSELAGGPHDHDASCWRLGMARPPRFGFRAPVCWRVVRLRRKDIPPCSTAGGGGGRRCAAQTRDPGARPPPPG